MPWANALCCHRHGSQCLAGAKIMEVGHITTPGTSSAGIAPRNSKQRTCEPTKSGRLCVQVASA